MWQHKYKNMSPLIYDGFEAGISWKSLRMGKLFCRPTVMCRAGEAGRPWGKLPRARLCYLHV